MKNRIIDDKLLHEPAMTTVVAMTGAALAKGFRNLAEIAANSGAAQADCTISWLHKDEEVDARYVPELIYRVRIAT